MEEHIFLDLVYQLLKYAPPVFKLVGATIVEALVVCPAMKRINGRLLTRFVRAVLAFGLVILGRLHLFEHPNFLFLSISS